ncbi:uncharacterized protein SPAPADRAFT_139118 [Spathaspora passalidarum NRRL Y-27907]|uniref:L-ornithine N(5)-monooxygenase n=1 Tax=Spathaspora passalidarum (strain NRRL Y-27907 / 11-Y1) TaxID=619300 RepID=G3AMW7_SPAPN|nr:uncharacterized protein SPAPADRAFT_139118 [Spathaspora passalidarum NRRL Y-27907]EGW32381.1 hypothetical protein SPAPADRAFT_139118 [Spathaspora passalidarum NRRL Y-27907]
MNSEIIEIEEENFREIIIVGAGPCGLAAATRLCESCPGSIYTEDEHQRFHWLKQRGSRVNLIHHHSLQKKSKTNYKCNNFKASDILVLDGTRDSFMGQWDSQFSACQIPYLRSPMFFHPDPVNIDGLVTFAHMYKREKDLMEISNVVGKEWSKHKQRKLQRKREKKVPLPTGKTSGVHDKPGIIDINMRDWKDYYRPSTPLFRDFCNDIITRYNLESVVKKDEVVSIAYRSIKLENSDESGRGMVVTTASGKVFGCKSCIVTSGHRGQINYPIAPFTDPYFPIGSCHTTHLFSKEVKFLGDEIFMKPKVGLRSIVIAGGGLTSAQLAHVACQDPRIDKVYLLFRGQIKIKHFDFHLDWVTKYKNVKKSAFYILDTDDERAQMVNDAREGGSINPEYYKKLNQHVKSGNLDWLTHTTIRCQEWNGELQCWNLIFESKVQKKDKSVEMKEISLENVDYIYFATGITADINSLGFLGPVLKENPIEVVRGFPCLTDDLQWNNEVPLFISGKNASLKMGPTSANLDGARLGAERIGWYLQDLKSRGKLDWSPISCTELGCCSSSENSTSLEFKLDQGDSESEEELESSFETRLKLSSGQMNWYTLLEQ